MGVTEKCFNQGHMEFYGNTTWTYPGDINKDRKYDAGKWRAIPATRTRVNTVPVNSEWAQTAGFKNGFKDRPKLPRGTFLWKDGPNPGQKDERSMDRPWSEIDFGRKKMDFGRKKLTTHPCVLRAIKRDSQQ